MRPHVPVKRSRSMISARVLMAEGLGWLRGYPAAGSATAAGLPWCVPPELGEDAKAKQLHITREHLRAASEAHRKLYNRFPVVLPLLVGDRDVWSARVSSRLAFIKEALHAGARLPSAVELLDTLRLPPAARKELASLARRHPAFGRLLEALLWVHGPEPERIERAASILARWAERLDTLVLNLDARGLPSIALSLRLVDLVLYDGESRLGSICEHICDSRAFQTPLEGEDWVAQSFCWSSTPPLGKPEAQLGPLLLKAIDSLARLPQEDRRARLELLRLVLPGQLLDRWERWWRRADPLRSRAGTLAEHLSGVGVEPGAVLKGYVGEAPPVYPAKWILEAVLNGPAVQDIETTRAIASALRLIPAAQQRALPRIQLLAHWSSYTMAREGTLRTIAASLARLLKGHPAPMQVLSPWSRVLQSSSDLETGRGRNLAPDRLFLDGHLAPQGARAFFAALRAICLDRGLFESIEAQNAEESWEAVAYLSAGLVEPERTASVVKELVRKGVLDRLSASWRLHGDVPGFVRALDLLSKGSASTLAELLGGVLRSDLEEDDLSALRRALESPRGQLLAARGVLAGRTQQLVAIGRKLDLLGGSGSASPIQPLRIASERQANHAAWMKRYPQKARETLKRLAAATPDAERIAGRLLSAFVLPDDHIQREIAKLEHELPLATQRRAENMRRRARSLRDRLESKHAGPSPARIKRLLAKLETRADLALLDTWESELDHLLQEKLRLQHGIDAPQGWLDGAGELQILQALLRLRPHERTLAVRLLRARMAPPPWDLRGSPANAAFLERMGRRGIDMKPWLDGIGTREEELAKGQRVLLRLEDDPFEVFRMGAYFNTCLSPGDCNFFSVVANAADINKRVLYARTVNGVVAGRCLLALTREGTILMFHVYAHDPGSGLHDKVSQLVQELAERMGTYCASSGEVEALEAREWYDDGPIDATGQLDFARDGSPFRVALRSAAPEELNRLLERFVGPRALDELFLPVLFRLQEVTARAELVEALLPHVRRLVEPPVELLLTAAQTLRKAERRELASELVLAAEARSRRCLRFNDARLADALADELIALRHPVPALRLLRATRPRRVRRWDQEAPWRLLAAARGHALLHRTAVARRLYRIVQTSCPDELTEQERAWLARTLPS